MEEEAGMGWGGGRKGGETKPEGNTQFAVDTLLLEIRPLSQILGALFFVFEVINCC